MADVSCVTCPFGELLNDGAIDCVVCHLGRFSEAAGRGRVTMGSHPCKHLDTKDEINAFLRMRIAQFLEGFDQEEKDGYFQIFPLDRFPDGPPDGSLLAVVGLCRRTMRARSA
jgi:hypothetical protein